MSEQDNTPKALRRYCQQIGVTPEKTGQPIETLIALARNMDDPRAWLAALIDAPPEEEPAKSISREISRPNPADLVEPASVPTRETIAKDLRVNVSAREGVPRKITPGITMAQPVGPPHAATVRAISLALPISDEEPVGYLEREMHLDVRLDPAASRAFRRLWNALDAQNARVKNGRHVGRSRADVVRWVFEQLAAVIEGERCSE
jgi:hypothetical protein